MTKIDNLLSRLTNVKNKGRGEYTACCPAHNDRSPSLAIKDNDGKIVLKCFGGCETAAVLDAIGLGFDDLFPDSISGDRSGAEKISPKTLLKILAFEAKILLIAIHKEQLSDSDKQRVRVAERRINDALNYINKY